MKSFYRHEMPVNRMKSDLLVSKRTKESDIPMRYILNLLSLKSLCTKFHLKWQLFIIYLLLYKKNTLENFEHLLYIILPL